MEPVFRIEPAGDFIVIRSDRKFFTVFYPNQVRDDEEDYIEILPIHYLNFKLK